MEELAHIMSGNEKQLSNSRAAAGFHTKFAQIWRFQNSWIRIIDAAQASIDRGEGIEITQQSMRELAEDVKRRGRARLAAEQPSTTR